MPNPRTIVVTGANRGIGRAICQTLLSRTDLGPLRLIAASRSGDDLGLLDDQTQPHDHREVLYRRLDIADRDSVRAFAADATALAAARDQSGSGGVDVLINNAGVQLDAAYSADSVRTTLDINFRGTREMCLAFLPHMSPTTSSPADRSRRPRIINMSSVACTLKPYSAALQARFRAKDLSLAGLEEIAQSYEDAVATQTEQAAGFGPPVRAYAVSKALVTGLTRVLAREHDGRANVYACCPGWVATDMGRLVGRGNASKTAEEGARVPVHLAVDAGVEHLSGVYWANESVRSREVGRVMDW